MRMTVAQHGIARKPRKILDQIFSSTLLTASAYISIYDLYVYIILYIIIYLLLVAFDHLRESSNTEEWKTSQLLSKPSRNSIPWAAQAVVLSSLRSETMRANGILASKTHQNPMAWNASPERYETAAIQKQDGSTVTVESPEKRLLSKSPVRVLHGKIMKDRQYSLNDGIQSFSTKPIYNIL